MCFWGTRCGDKTFHRLLNRGQHGKAIKLLWWPHTAKLLHAYFDDGLRLYCYMQQLLERKLLLHPNLTAGTYDIVSAFLNSMFWSAWKYEKLLKVQEDFSKNFLEKIKLKMQQIWAVISVLTVILMVMEGASRRRKPGALKYFKYILWWRHRMEPFSALLALCARNSPVTGEFLAQRPVTRNFDIFFDLSLNKRLSKQSSTLNSKTGICDMFDLNLSLDLTSMTR